MVGLFLRSSQHQAALLAEWVWEMKHGHTASRVATNRIQARGKADPGNGHVYRAKWREHCPARRVSAWTLDSRDIDCVSSKSMVRAGMIPVEVFLGSLGLHRARTSTLSKVTDRVPEVRNFQRPQ